MNMSVKVVTAISSVVALSLLTMGSALADNAKLFVVHDNLLSSKVWVHHHERRAEVLNRVMRFEVGFNKEVRDHYLTPAREAEMHRAIESVIQTEEREAKRQGGAINGHITPAQQKALNQREDAISREVSLHMVTVK
jgi:hypothetical protein